MFKKNNCMILAPIILFAFNRLNSLERTIISIKSNLEAVDTDIFIFVDGPRSYIPGEKERVKNVQDFVQNIRGFKSIHYYFSSENKGLGPSIIYGVTKIINQYGRAIVLEDDLILSKNCLAFLNQGLDRFENEPKVFSICGYSNMVEVPVNYSADSYFCVRSSSWGWATWKDRWNSVDWELKDWSKCETQKNAFNKWGGSDCFGMLEAWKEGKNKSWAIRFCFAQFIQNKLSLFPIFSKINNNGFDGDGTNCRKYSRFKFDFDEGDNKKFIYPESVEINYTLYKSAKSYHSICKRIWSRIMYTLNR